MATIGQLAVSLGLDTKEFDKGTKNVESRSGKMKSGLMTVGKVAAGLVGGLAALGAGAFALGTKVGNLADEILDLESITGMTTESIQQWRKVTEVAGVSTDAMTNASQKLTKSLDVMSMESNKGNKSLQQLGFSLEEIESMNADERMDALVVALSEVDDKTERAKLGTDLFGNSWKEIAPVVDLGAEAMQNAKDSANIISDDDLKKANDFRITVANMKDQVSFLFTELAIKLLPILQSTFDWVQANMPQIQAVFAKAFEIIGNVVNETVDIFNQYLLPIWKDIFAWVKENMPQIQATFQEVFKVISDIIQAYVTLQVALWDVFGDMIINTFKIVWTTVKEILSGAVKIIQGIIDTFIGLFTGDWERMGEGLKKIWQGLWQAIESIVRGAWNLLSNAFSSLKSSISNWFSNLGRDARQWGKNMISGFVDGIKSMGSAVANAARDTVDQAADFLKFWSPAKKGEGRFIVDWGENMIDGFLDGVKNAMPDVASTFNKVIPDMSPTLTPQMAGVGSTNTFNGGDIIIQNMQVRNDNDIKLVARELHTLQQSRGRGNGIG